MKKKPSVQSDNTFSTAIKIVDLLTPKERVALMKYISASLGGPRFFTGQEVEKMMVQVVNETREREALFKKTLEQHTWEQRQQGRRR